MLQLGMNTQQMKRNTQTMLQTDNRKSHSTTQPYPSRFFTFSTAVTIVVCTGRAGVGF